MVGTGAIQQEIIEIIFFGLLWPRPLSASSAMSQVIPSIHVTTFEDGNFMLWRVLGFARDLLI